MKTKKPRSRKAVKPAARIIRRVVRTKPKAPRLKALPAKGKGRKSKTTRTPKKPAKRKTRAVVKPKTVRKTVRKAVIRKPRAKSASVPRRQVAAGILPAVEGGILPPGKSIIRSATPEISNAPLLAHAFGRRAGKPGSTAGRMPAATEAAKATGGLNVDQPAPPDSGMQIPQILLEGDEPFSPPMTELGEKCALGPTTPADRFGSEAAALPEAYGTGHMLLAARDPHWLYAHWDLTLQQQRQYNALSADHHLVVRVYPGTVEAQPVTEAHVHPESRHWFIHVDRADTRYVAELGYYRQRHQWVAVATSPPAVTPADTVSMDKTVRFSTIPARVRLAQLAAAVEQAVPADLPPADAPRECALADLVGRQLARQDWAGSAGIPDLVRGRGEEEISAAQLLPAAPLGGEVESVSSPMAVAEQRPGGFWLNVNAEIVIYGATEPGASVTIGGRPITLRPDGTFSFRCSLPDGDHAVTVSAMSTEGDLRQAALEFSRRTEYRGDVGATSQDPSLHPPAVENP